MTPLQEALAPRSDQLNADDLIVGPRTLKITGARIVEGDRGGKKITINFEGDNGKPWKPCKTMGRAMVMVWAITDEAQLVGKAVTVYRDPEVSFGDQGKIGGIRISHMSHIDGPKTVKLTVSQGKKSTFVFKPLTADVLAMPDKAAAWVAGQIEAIEAIADADALDALTSKGSKPMGKLLTERPELHAQVMAAYEAKRATFAPDEEDDPFGLPPLPDESEAAKRRAFAEGEGK